MRDSLKELLEIVEGREFWLYVTYSILGFGVAVLYWGDLGGWTDRGDRWLKALGALIYGAMHVAWFRYLVEKEYMLWVEFAAFIAPAVLISLITCLSIRESAEFVLTIPGYAVLWLVTRWFYGTIPEE